MGLLIFKLGFVIFFSFIFQYSFRKAKNHQFFSDVPLFLLPTGIFVWGDGLVLSLFWIAAAIFSLIAKLNWHQLGQFYLLFLIVRSGLEAIYWIQHQMVRKDYQPPHLRNVKWLGAEEQGIIYQLIHISVVVMAAAILFITL